MKIRDVINIIRKDGWSEVRQKDSHKQYKHSVKKGLVTIACHKTSDDIAPGTLDSILKQAQIKNKR